MCNRARLPLFAVLVILLTLAACGNAPTPPVAQPTAHLTGTTYAPVINPAKRCSDEYAGIV
jgi:hypothetical protein